MNKGNLTRIHSKDKQTEISNMRAFSFFLRFFIATKGSLYFNKLIFIHSLTRSLTILFSINNQIIKKDMDRTTRSTHNSKIITLKSKTKKSSHDSSISNRVCIITTA